MPSLVTHIAIGKKYIEKHKNQEINEEEFLKGSIMPDLNEEMTELSKTKNITHYGKWEGYKREINIDLFLKDSKVELAKDYWRGYLLHLLTDYYFYDIYFKEEYDEVIKNNDNYYYDFDSLNNILIPKYNIIPIKNLEKYMMIDENKTEPQYLNKEKVINFIEKMSDLNLDEQIKKVEEKGMGGLK